MRKSWVWAVGLSVVLGCGRGPHASPRTPTGEASRLKMNPQQISEDEFPKALHDALVGGTPQEKAPAGGRWAGILARQMSRTAERFRKKQPDRALASLNGAVLLIKAGDYRPEDFGPDGLEALREASREYASRGDEGRARATYEMVRWIAGDAEKKDATQHIEAIDAWVKSALGRGEPVVSSAARQRVMMRRALIEPTVAARDEGAEATKEWIRQALALRAGMRTTRTAPPRDEVQDAFRALKSGVPQLASIYLRHGDPAGALRSIGESGLAEQVSDPFLRGLETLASKPSAGLCLDLIRALKPPEGREGNGDDRDGSDEQELFGAAAFRLSLEAYRLDPTLPETALLLASALQQYGMADASPALLAEAVKAHPDPRVVAAALSVTMQAMAAEIDANEPEGARRAFRSAGPLLVVADGKEFAGKVQPGPARVRALMGEVEVREGRLSEGRSHYLSAIAKDPSGLVLLSLARVEAHTGDLKGAETHARAALTQPDATKSPSLRGETMLLLAEVLRDKGDAEGARTVLTDALRTLVSAPGRKSGSPDERVRIERTLSRVLDRFGAAQPAQRALERALSATPMDKQQTAATAGQWVGRALLRGDLPGAREGLMRALAADVPSDDLLYLALWVRFLERQSKVPTEGAAGRVFASVPDDGRWVGKLSAFGAGKLKPEQLVAAAANPPQKVEALFYQALERRVAGDKAAADAGFKQVLQGPGVDLMETGFAREFLASPKALTIGPMPTDIPLP